MKSEEIDWEAEALRIMRLAKDADAMFFGEDRCRKMAPMWGRIFAASGETPKSLRYGVERYYTHATGDVRPKPGDIVHQARLNRQEWLQTPKGREWAEKERLKAQQERDKALENGTWTPRGT